VLKRGRGVLALAAAVAVIALGGAGLVGCFNPKIADGGLLCATKGTPCPDGFTCIDRHCRKNGTVPTDGSPAEVSPPDAAPDTMMCTPVVASLCATGARAGQDCNPTCQTGCACKRCNVVGRDARCVPVPDVAKQLGDSCNLTADDCAPGLICFKELCGNNLGRCYQHCTTDDQCNGGHCQFSIVDATNVETTYKVCDVALRACDPVSNTGCPDPAFICYLTGTGTLCDCPGRAGMNGDECSFYSQCAARFVCIGSIGDKTRCRYACELGTPTCPAGSSCVSAGTDPTYGYCRPN
jgi:hypothetical protein